MGSWKLAGLLAMKQNVLLLALAYAAGPILLAASTLGCISGKRASVDESQPGGSQLTFIKDDRELTEPGPSDQVRPVAYQEDAREAVPGSDEHVALVAFQTTVDGDDSPDTLPRQLSEPGSYKFDFPPGKLFSAAMNEMQLEFQKKIPGANWQATTFSEDFNFPNKVTISAKSINDAIRQLEEQTGVLVGWRDEDKTFIVHSEKRIANQKIDDVMNDMLFFLPYGSKTQYASEFVGRDNLQITATILPSSLDDRIRQLEEQTGVLVGREGNTFIVHTEVEFENTSLEQAMREMLKGLQPYQFEVVGRADKLITAAISSDKIADRIQKLDDRLHQLEEQTGVLIVRRGNKVSVYSEGPKVDKTFEIGTALEEVVGEILFDRRFRIIGNPNERISEVAAIRAHSTDDAIEQLEAQTGVRVVRRGDVYNVHSRNFAANWEFKGEAERDNLDSVMRTMTFGVEYTFDIVGDEHLPITATIRAYSIDEAMQQLEDQTGLLIVRQGNAFVVYAEDAEAMLQDEPITYVYKCRQSKAWDLIGIVENEPPKGFPQAGDPNISTFSTGFIAPQSQATRALSTKMPAAPLTSPLGATDYQIVHHLNAVVLQGQYKDVRDAVDFLRMIDRPMPIVFVELLIVQYFHEDAYTWRYNFFSGQVAKGDPFVSDNGGFSDAPVSETPPGPGNFFGPRANGINFEDIAVNALTGDLPLSFSSVGALTVNFQENLRHLVSENQARVVTNPRVAVINGHKGTILQNEQFNFTLNDVATGATTTITETLQKLDAVTALTVTPTVISPKQIHIAVNATLSVFLSNAIGGNVQVDLPDQRQNDLATSVVLFDNQTLIIGGLVREDMLEERDKYPFLAKTPVVGHLFRGKTDDKRFIETVIYITPHLEQSDRYQDDYMKEVFRQTERMQDRGEFIRNENRIDKYRFESQFRFKETLDHQQHKRLKSERIDDKHLRHQEGTLHHQHHP